MAVDRITIDPQVMGGKPCIRGRRVTVGMIVGMLAEGHTAADILNLYPYLEPEDISQALSYAALRSEEREIEVEGVKILIDMKLSPQWCEWPW
jgi:uncharacterized protein (DUF433 family)